MQKKKVGGGFFGKYDKKKNQDIWLNNCMQLCKLI